MHGVAALLLRPIYLIFICFSRCFSRSLHAPGQGYGGGPGPPTGAGLQAGDGAEERRLGPVEK